MKKVIILILALFAATVLFGGNGNGNKYSSLNLKDTLIKEEIKPAFEEEQIGENEIKIYMFRGSGCSHCTDLLNFLNSIEKEYGEKFDFISYEVWQNKNNSKLKDKVINELDVTSTGVPLLVIGEKTFVGFSSSSEEAIKEAIDNEYNNEVRSTRVEEIINKKNNDNSALIILLPILSFAIIYETIKVIKFKKQNKKTKNKKDKKCAK